MRKMRTRGRAELEEDVEAEKLAVFVAEDGIRSGLAIEGPVVLLVEGARTCEVEHLENERVAYGRVLVRPYSHKSILVVTLGSM